MQNTLKFSAQPSNRVVGNFENYFWCLLEIPIFNTELILDLGPELVDQAALFIPQDSGWILQDQTGKTVFNTQKKIQGVRCSLKIPANQSRVLLQIKNSDATALVFRLYGQNEYFLQTLKFNLLHGISIAVFIIALCSILCVWIFTKKKNLLKIFFTELCFFVYQLCMKGIGSAVLWNTLARTKLFLHLSYIAATFGFVLILAVIFDCLNFEMKSNLKKEISSALIGCALLFSVMFLLSPNFVFVCNLAICVLIFGCIFEVIVIVRETKKRKYDFSILIPWACFFVFVVFRQSFHLLRSAKDYFLISAIMDDDYYFSYDLAFLMINVLYLIIFANQKKHLKNHAENCGENSMQSANIENPAQKTEKEIPMQKQNNQNTNQAADIRKILSEYNLTPREIDVAECLYSKQNSNKEISVKLNISINTANTHIKHIFEKTSVNSRFAFYKLVSERLQEFT